MCGGILMLYGRGWVKYLVSITAFILMCLHALLATGAVYRYVDEGGKVHFSNVPVESRFTFYASEPSDTVLENASVHELVEHYARKYSLDPALVKAVVKAESNFNPRSVSSAGARGLMQVMPATALEMEIYDLYDPSQNIAAGSLYLRRMFERFDGDLDLALAAYNAGPAIVEKYGGVPPYAETRTYLENVKKYFNQYRTVTQER
ncbi:MAG: transglycosylase SLT domain-containing protein [Desulfuromonadaceae bacterium]